LNAIRSEERETLRHALSAELISLRYNIKGDLDELTPVIEKTGGVSFYTHSMMLDRMYDRVLDRVGLLTPNEAQAVIYAYTTSRLLKFQVESLRSSIGSDEKRQPDFEGALYVPASISRDVIAFQGRQLESINRAILALSNGS